MLRYAWRDRCLLEALAPHAQRRRPPFEERRPPPRTSNAKDADMSPFTADQQQRFCQSR